MESHELIGAFRSQLDEVERQGHTAVQISALRSYLSALERDASMSQEQRTRQHEGILAHYAARNDYSIAMLEAVLEAGKTALQSLLIINGGAVVALLGVLSNLAGKPEGSLLARYLAMPLLQFGVAVLLGALGFAFRYFSQACYSEMPEENSALRKWGHGLRYSAITCAVIGYLLFGIAIVNSYHGVVWAFAAR